MLLLLPDLKGILPLHTTATLIIIIIISSSSSSSSIVQRLAQSTLAAPLAS
jgi:hypothetical protein